MLRLLNLVLCLVMIVFAALQYNDRDMLLWVVYYIVPAAWAFVAAFRHRLFQSVQWLGGCGPAWRPGWAWSGTTGRRCPTSGTPLSGRSK
jgi:Transmembrane family 220, helix